MTDLKFYREVLFPLAKGLIVGETQKEMDGREQRLWDDVASGLQTPGVIDIVQELDAIWRRGGITAPSPPVAPKPPTSSPHDKCCDRMSLLEDNGHLVCTKCAIVHSVISEWSFEQIKGMGPSLPTPVAKSSVNQAVHDIISRTHGTVSRLAGIAIEQLVTERVARGVSIRTITEHQQADIIRYVCVCVRYVNRFDSLIHSQDRGERVFDDGPLEPQVLLYT